MFRNLFQKFSQMVKNPVNSCLHLFMTNSYNPCVICYSLCYLLLSTLMRKNKQIILILICSTQTRQYWHCICHQQWKYVFVQSQDKLQGPWFQQSYAYSGSMSNLFNSTWLSHYQHHNKSKTNSINPLLLQMLPTASSGKRDINKNLLSNVRSLCLKIKLLSGLTTQLNSES